MDILRRHLRTHKQSEESQPLLMVQQLPDSVGEAAICRTGAAQATIRKTEDLQHCQRYTLFHGKGASELEALSIVRSTIIRSMFRSAASFTTAPMRRLDLLTPQPLQHCGAG